jgi:WD40 repeat protein
MTVTLILAVHADAQEVGPLPRGALIRLGTRAFRHADNITAVAFSPDGTLVATAGRDHAACVWDRATGRLRHRIHDDEVDFQSVTFSPDSRRLVLTGCKFGRTEGTFLLIHDTVTGQELYRLGGHEQPVSALWFTPGESFLVSVSADQVLRWDLNTGRSVEQRGQDWPTGVVALAPDRPVLAFASNKRDDPLIQLLNPVTGQTLFTIDGELKEVPDPQVPDRTQTKLVKPEQSIVALALSSGGKLLASGSPFEAIRLWDGATGHLVRALDDPQGGIALAFSPDNKYLASGTINGVVRLWDVATGKEVRKFPGFKAWVNALAFSPDGKTLAVAGAESRTLYLWDVATGKDLRPGPGHRGAVQAVGFSADGRLLTTAGCGRDDAGQSVCVWEAATGKLLNQFGKFDARVLAYAFSAGSKKLAVAEEHESSPRLVDVAAGHTFDRFQIPAEINKTEDGRDADLRFMALSLSPDGRLLAGGSSDGKLFLWETADGTCVRWWKGHQAMVTSVAFAPDGKRIMSSAEDHTARMWDAATAAEVCQFTHDEDTFGGLHFAPDGKRVAALSAWCDGKLYLFDLETRRELKRIQPGPKKINQVAFAPNGKMLAVCDVGGTITLYEVATGKPRATLTGHAGEITALAFSPDGLRLATGGADATALIWDATEGHQGDPNWQTPLSDIHLAKLWQDLASDDVALAYRAMWHLAACPEHAEPFLTTRLKQAPRPTAAEIQVLIRQLDDSSYVQRALATKALLNLGKQAEPQLRQALNQPQTTEVEQRLQVLLGRLDMAELGPEQVRTERALETLDWIGTKNISTDLHAQWHGK